jgi:ankyrin repeat protein
MIARSCAFSEARGSLARARASLAPALLAILARSMRATREAREPFDAAATAEVFDAIRRRDDAAVRRGVERGLDVNAVEPDAGDADGTLLVIAVACKRGELAEWLLARGADPTARDAAGHDALALAVRHGHARVAAALRGA